MWGGEGQEPLYFGGGRPQPQCCDHSHFGGGSFSPAERGAGTPPPRGSCDTHGSSGGGYGGGGHLWGVMGGQGEGGALWGAPQRLPAVLQAEHIQHPHRDKRMDPIDPHRTM